MNKKTVAITSSAVAIAMALSACGTKSYSYDVSGTVEGQQVDYDCPGEDLAMSAVAFVTGKSGSSGGSSSSSSGKSSSSSSGSSGGSKSGSGSSSQRQGSSSGSNSNSNSNSKSDPKPVKNKGVKLDKKPDRPERLKSMTLPRLLVPASLKGCEKEYEVFVLAKDGYLYEQDVREVDYRKCEDAKIPAGQKAKLFPLCTKG